MSAGSSMKVIWGMETFEKRSIFYELTRSEGILAPPWKWFEGICCEMNAGASINATEGEPIVSEHIHREDNVHNCCLINVIYQI